VIKDRHALILGTNKGGSLEGIIALTVQGSAARLKTMIARIRADLECRGLNVRVELSGR
jgi:hypothetical protein